MKTNNMVGAFFDSSLSSTVYVSQAIGVDSTSNGSMLAPYASISYAITQVGSPLNPVTIEVIDASIYAENLVINNGNIGIYAPRAKLIPATGDAVTLTFNAPIPIEFVTIAPTSGNVATISTFGNLFIRANEAYGPLSAGQGAIYINAALVIGNYDAGTGQIYGFVGQSFGGTLTGAVTVMTSAGPLV